MDFRPVAQILGYLHIAMGAMMLPSAAVDLMVPRGQSWHLFAIMSTLTILVGLLTVIATRETDIRGLSTREAFLLTTGVWASLPFTGSLPFVFGVPGASITDAYFEAMSGMTTTGATVFVGLDDMPYGTLLWRGMLQWLGGLGIVIVALIFLPTMKVGGMQFFRSEGFDTLGKVMPRALDISRNLLSVYVGLTFLCFLAFLAFGMTTFDALVHALTTMSTGGFSTSDASFGKFIGPLEYVCTVFMILASLPFIRFVEALNGRPGAPFRDIQARAYLRWMLYAIVVVVAYRSVVSPDPLHDVVRETVFNVATLFSGTGFGSTDVTKWGAFPFGVIILVGLIGGCTASTGCSIKVFRWQIVFAAISARVRKIQSPSGIFHIRYGEQSVPQDVLDSVIAFFSFFILSFGALAVMLNATGLTFGTALTAAWTSIANVGPAFGPEVGPTGAMTALPTPAKWMMIGGMLLGRLEVLSVFVLFTPYFWRD